MQLHGDASFAGQGVVMESLGLSEFFSWFFWCIYLGLGAGFLAYTRVVVLFSWGCMVLG